MSSPADRINALLRSGLGLSPDVIAAIVGLEPDDVHKYLHDQHVTPPAPSGGGGGTSAGRYTFAAEYELPAWQGVGEQPQALQPMPGSDMVTVPADTLFIVTMQAEMFQPVITADNALTPGQVGQLVNMFVYVQANMAAPPANLDLAAANPMTAAVIQSNTQFGGDGTTPMEPPGEWYTVGVQQPMVSYAIADTDLAIVTQASDINVNWWVPGSKVRNLVVTVAQFPAASA